MDPERAARLKRGADSLAYLAKTYIDACQTAAKTFEDGVRVLEKSYGPLPVRLPSLTGFPELKKARKGPPPRKVRVVGEDTPVEHPAMLALLDDLDKALQGGSGDEGLKQPQEDETLPLNTPATLDESQLIAMPTVENPPAMPTAPAEGETAAGNSNAVAAVNAAPAVFGMQQTKLDGEVDATAMLSVAMAMETAIADAAAKAAAAAEEREVAAAGAAAGEEEARGSGADEQMKGVEEQKPQVEAEMPQAGGGTAARRSSRRSAAQGATATRTVLRTAGKGRTKGT